MTRQQLLARGFTAAAAVLVTVGVGVGPAVADPSIPVSPTLPSPRADTPVRPVGDTVIPAVPPPLDVPDTLRSPAVVELAVPQLPPPAGVPVVSVPVIDVVAPAEHPRIPLPPI